MHWGILLACVIALGGGGGYVLTAIGPERSQMQDPREPGERWRTSAEVMTQGTPLRGADLAQRLPPSGGLTENSHQGVTERDGRGGPSTDSPLQRSAPAAVAEVDPVPTLRIYVHIRSLDQIEEARHLAAKLKGQGYVFPKAEILVEKGPQRTQVRYFRPTDAPEATKITSLLKQWQHTDATTRYIQGYENSPLIKPGHYEIWLRPTTLH